MLSYVNKSVVCEEDLSQKEPVVFGNVELSDNEKEILMTTLNLMRKKKRESNKKGLISWKLR